MEVFTGLRQSEEGSASPEVLQAALHYLMTRYQQRPSRGVALSVVHHLEVLIRHPLFRPEEVDAMLYVGLVGRWKAIAMTQPENRSFVKAAVEGANATLH